VHILPSLTMTSEATKPDGRDRVMPRKPAKGKRFTKVVKNKKTGATKTISFGQKGASIRPGTKKGDAYCARSMGIKRRLPKSKRNDPNTPNNLSRKKWKCRGTKSMR